MRAQALRWFSGLFLVSLLGCGGTGHPATAPVTGLVRLDGTPVEGASVSFYGEDASQAATGMTDAEGKFTLTTFKPNDGAVAGHHKVVVIKPSASSGGADPDNPGAMPDDSTPSVSQLPEIYANPTRTPLKADVEAGKTNDFIFDLTRQ